MATASVDNVCGLSNLSCRPGQDVYVAMAANGSAIDVMMIVIAIVMAPTAWRLPMVEEYQDQGCIRCGWGNIYNSIGGHVNKRAQ